MRRVIIESPYAGDTGRNENYARQCLLDCLRRGESPLCSHLLYTQVLDDDNPDERKLGIEAGHAWARHADAVVFYVDHGITPGMAAAYTCAEINRIPIEFREISDMNNGGRGINNGAN